MAKFGTPKSMSWNGWPVTTTTGSPEQLAQLLTPVERVPFVMNGVENPRLDVLMSADGFPIGDVSKGYGLAQHSDIFAAAQTALTESKLNQYVNTTTLQRSEHGQWFRAIFEMKGFDFTPNDGYPMVLRLEVSNSMDCTRSIWADLKWFRLVCGNLMMVAIDRMVYRLAHKKALVEELRLKDWMEEAIDLVPTNKGKMLEWQDAEIDQSTFPEWVNTTLQNQWSQKAAARIHEIATTGFDGSVAQVEDDVKDTIKATERTVRHDIQVPGQPTKAVTALDIAHAMSWLIKTKSSVSGQAYGLMQLPKLVDNLAFGTPLTLRKHMDIADRTEHED